MTTDLLNSPTDGAVQGATVLPQYANVSYDNSYLLPAYILQSGPAYRAQINNIPLAETTKKTCGCNSAQDTDSGSNHLNSSDDTLTASRNMPYPPIVNPQYIPPAYQQVSNLSVSGNMTLPAPQPAANSSVMAAGNTGIGPAAMRQQPSQNIPFPNNQ